MPNFTHSLHVKAHALYVSLFTFLLAGSITVRAQQPAFPGAEGAGKYTSGGRGTASVPTAVFEVTNLNDDGNAGCLRWALTQAATYRTIVFRVSGTIHLNSKLNIRDNVTIAGQTAPGDGICCADYPVVISGNNVIVRYMRFRMGDKNQDKGMVNGSGGDDSFGGTGVNNIIIDHCSVSWSDDECLTIYRGDNLTIQWCFITEPLNFSYHFETGDGNYENHGYGGIWGAKHGSMHHNLFADCRNRNPRFAGISTYTPAKTIGIENCDFRNNVIYNWGINTVYGGDGGNYNVVNNYYKWGPNTSSGVKYRICNPSINTTDTIPFGKWYVNGNYVDGSTTNTNNNWSGVYLDNGADTNLSKVNTPFDLGYPLNTQTATSAYDSVLANAGCTLPRRDTLDQRIVNDVRNRTGRIIDVQGGYPHGTAYSLTVNAWPTLNSTTAPIDTDHDGMPDAWETAHGLNPNDASDRNTYDANGYTMLEEYLNGVVNNDPAIAVGGSLKTFSQTSATPSSVQTYTVAGYNLTGNVTVTPPAGYEISVDGTTWYNSSGSLTLTPVSGTLSSTTISVRLNASAEGSYSGNIVHVSSGATTLNLAITGTYSSVANGVGSYTDVDGGFEHQTVGSYSNTIVSNLRTYTGIWEASASFNIVQSGARTGSKYFHFNQGSTSNKYAFSPALTTTPLTASTSYVIQFWYRDTARVDSTTTLSGWATTTAATGGTGSSTATATAVLSPSTTPGVWQFYWGTLTTSSSTPTTTYPGLKIAKPWTPYFDIDDYVIYPGTTVDNVAPDVPTSAALTGNASNNTVHVSWTGPATGVDGGGYVVVRSTSAALPVPNVGGVYIAGNDMGAGYKVVYLGANTSFTDADSTLSGDTKYHYYIFTVDKACNFSGAALQDSIVIGQNTATPPAIAVSGTLSAFSQTVGTPSSVKTFTVSGNDLTDSIRITPPAGYEISTNGTTFSTSVIKLAPAADGSVATTTISVRLNGSVAGTYSGNIVVSTTGATSVNVAVSGTTTALGGGPADTKLVVAKDGTGNYTSIQAAINAAPTAQTAPYKIYIKKGKYVETVNIPGNKPFIQLVGESMAETIISYDNYSGKVKPAGSAYGTSDCGTLIVNAPDIMLMNLSIENSTGYGIDSAAAVPAPGDGPQAVAVYTTSDRVVFYNCRFNSGQDTYYGGNNPATRCYLKNCYIDGNTDFMFGSSTIIFDTCIIYPRTRLDRGTGGYVTAVNTQVGSLYGYVFRDCKITKNRGITTYSLGRPWQNDASTTNKAHNKTVFLNTTMGSTVQPAGWSTWDGGTNTSYITYGEYNSKNYNGTAVNVGSRVSWSKQLTAADAVNYYNNDTVFMNASTPQMTAWNPYATWAELRNTFNPELSVSNLIARKGSVTSSITWNLTWPMTGITCDLYRSSDGSNFTLISSQVSTEDSACNFSYSENIPSPGQTYYYIVKASKSGYTSITSDTAKVICVPTITVTGSLGSFVQAYGAPSATQAYTISGASMLGNITITPPAGYEVSTNNSTWYTNSNPLVLTQTNGAVPYTSILVRLNAGVGGTYSGNIVNASTGAASVNVAATGVMQYEPLPVSNALAYWPMALSNADSLPFRSAGVTPGTPSFGKFVLSNYSTVPAYSATHGQAFAPTADGWWTTGTGGPGGNLNYNFYEEFTIAGNSGYSVRVDSIVLNTSFYGSSSNTKLAVAYSLSGFAGDTAYVTGGTGPGGSLTSTANGGFKTPIVLNNLTGATTDNYRLALNAATGVTLAAGQTLSIRLYYSCGSTSVNKYAKVKDLYLKGFAKDLSIPDPVITTTGSLNSFSQVLGLPSVVQSYTVSGTYLTGNVLVVPPAGYEVSANGGSSWNNYTSPIVLTPTSGSLAATTIKVRLNASTVGTYNGDIINATLGISPVKVAITGTATTTPTVAVTGSLSAFSQTIGAASAVQTYSITGYNISDNITITPPAGYQVSADGTNWYNNASPLVLTPTSGNIATTTIRVRLNAATAGSYAGNIVHVGTGAVTQNVAVNGTAILAPVITSSGALSKFYQSIGVSSAVKAYTVSAAHLTAGLTITPPAGFEVSMNGGTWYNNSNPLVIALSGDSIPSTTISVRLNASATGTYGGNITQASTGATTINMAVTGETLNTPLISTGNSFAAFSQTVGIPANAQSTTLSVANVFNTVTITLPAGYELSLDTGKTWYNSTSAISITPSSANMISKTMMVRLNAGTAGTYNDNIVIQAPNAKTVNLQVTGTAYSEYSINPNPANNYVNIYHAKLYTIGDINIYNMDGIKVGTYRTKRATNCTTIDISSLPNGMYFVEFRRLNDKVLLRFVKQ